MHFNPSTQQQDFFNWIQNGSGSLILEAVAGSGKCLGVDTPVMLHDGTIRAVQDIKQGDFLMGMDSQPRQVLSTTTGRSQLYRITPVKGDSWVCNDVHVLTLRNGSTGEVFDIPLPEYIKEKGVTRGTRRISNSKQFSVGVTFNEKEISVDPYLLGLWLGDGAYSIPSISCPDKEIIDYLVKIAPIYGLTAKVSYPENKCPNIDLTGVNFSGEKNVLRDFFKTCIVSEEKRIPSNYLTNTREVRLQLLAGLLDTDGHLAGGYYEILTKYAGLRDDILFLARSLGFAAYTKQKIGKIKSLGFEGLYHRINIIGHVNEIPLQVARKIAAPRKQIKEATNTGFSVTPIGEGDYYGFTLNGDGRFLLGDFTVTHNTTSIVEATTYMKGDIFLGAYNKDIAAELQSRVSNKKVKVATLHGIGKGYMFKIDKNHTVNDKKCSEIYEVFAGNDKELREFRNSILNLVSYAKQAAVGITSQIDDDAVWDGLMEHFNVEDFGKPEVIRHMARKTLLKSNTIIDEIDFDDMIYIPLLKEVVVGRFDWVLIDEAQDTNETRRLISLAMLKPGGRLVAVGDRCQPEGTKVHTPKGIVNIENLKVGDLVTSYRPADVAFIKQGKRVNGITKRPYSGELVVVSDSFGRVSKYTPNHLCLANFSDLRDKYAVYMMRKGNQYRIGKCAMDYAHSSGVSARMHSEGASASWILAVYDTESEAFFMEQAISGKYGIPQLMFDHVKMSRPSAAPYLEKAWLFIGDNSSRAEDCLNDFGRNSKYPLFVSETGKHQTIKRPMVVYASNLMDGIKLLPFSGKGHTDKNEWVSVVISKEAYTGTVVSLDVEDTHLYVADGLVTHNCQAIYGFTGANHNSLDLIQEATGATCLPLSVTFRCGKNIVKQAQHYVPHIEAKDDADDGIVRHLNNINDVLTEAKKGNVILCRYNAPIMDLAYKLILNGIPAKIAGKDIGQQLKNLASKWISPKTLPEFVQKLEEYQDKECKKYHIAGKDHLVDATLDKVSCLMTIIDRLIDKGVSGSPSALIKAEIDAIFGDNIISNGYVTLSSIHKAKGLEWRKVIWMTTTTTRRMMPWEKQCEANLCYVAITRAKSELVMVPAPKIAKRHFYAAAEAV